MPSWLQVGSFIDMSISEFVNKVSVELEEDSLFRDLNLCPSLIETRAYTKDHDVMYNNSLPLIADIITIYLMFDMFAVKFNLKQGYLLEYRVNKFNKLPSDISQRRSLSEVRGRNT